MPGRSKAVFSYKFTLSDPDANMDFLNNFQYSVITLSANDTGAGPFTLEAYAIQAIKEAFDFYSEKGSEEIGRQLELNW
jgi:hypothetical protein